MTIDAASGRIEWTPTASQLGTTFVRVLAIDPQGAGSSQTYSLTVQAANRLPQIQSTPVTQVTAGGAYRYDVRSADPDGEPLTYRLVQAPTGMLIDGLGRLFWSTSVSNLGTHSVQVRVSDPRGGSAEQTFQLQVVADTQAPQVAIQVDRNPAPLGSRLEVLITSIDNVGVTSLVLTHGGQPVPLDAQGRARITLNTVGPVTLVATARDAAGNIGTKSFELLVFNPIDTDAPRLAITSPSADAIVTAPTNILGSVQDQQLVEYVLSYAKFGSEQYVEFARGSQQIENGILGRFDPSLLPNDTYVIRLTAVDAGGNRSVFEQEVNVAGELKLGNFRLSFLDLEIPVSGIPITVARTYDTLQANRESDFGYGWQLEFRDVDLRVNLPTTGMERLGIYTPYRIGTRVSVTLPGGERAGFTFNPSLRVLPGFGGSLVLATPRFTPDPGVTSELSVGGGQLLVNELGELHASGGIPWNPASPDFGGVYLVTKRDGTQYRIDGNSGKVQSATDRNGNRLLFSESGITGANGNAQLTFQRDTRGRIVGIVDPAGNKISYSYDSSGNLTSTIDRMGNRTTLQYNTTRPHYLGSITDPIGRTGTRSEYGPEGRLTSTIDAGGSTTTYTYDPDNRIVVRKNALNQHSILEFDSRGNLVGGTDAIGNVTRRTYDSQDNLLSETDALGHRTQFEYNTKGDLVATIDPLGNRTINTVNSMGMPVDLIDAHGNRSSFQYDVRGNLIASSDVRGHTTRYELDTRGKVTAVVDPSGVRRTSTYDAVGNVLSQTDGRGNTTTYLYDANGELLRRSSPLTNATGTQTTTATYSYDANGNKLTSTNELGLSRSFSYDAAGNLIRMTDEAGQQVSVTFDESNLLQGVSRPTGANSAFVYDSIGNRTKTTTNGESSWNEYDAVGRLLAIVYDDDTPDNAADNPRRRFEYDAAGRQTATTDERGNRTQYFYDAIGRLIRLVNPLGATETYAYDALGNRTQQTNPLGRTISYAFDQAGNITRVTYADNSFVQYAYDAMGRAIRFVDELGRITQYGYDPEGNLAHVIDSAGGRTEYQYDENNNPISIKDAANRITRYEYDLAGRQTATISPLGFRSETQFDAVGNPIRTTDADGRVNQNFFDAEGRVIRRELHDGQVVRFSYDLRGQLISMVDATGTTSMSYDKQGRLLQRTNGDGRSISYQYDAAGNVASVSMPGETLTYSYDAIGSLTAVQSSTSGLTSYTYDLNRNKTAIQNADGTRETRNHDLRDRLVSQSSLGANNTLLQQTTHILLANGLISNTVESGVNNRQVSFTYDVLNRLLSESETGVNPRTTAYTYDAVGNRLQKVDSIGGTTQNNYDLQDRLLSSSTNSVVTTYAYDRSGQLLSEVTGADQSTYTYTADGKLSSATVNSGGNSETVGYRYTGDGLRVSRISASGETRYLIDSNREYSEIAQEYSPAGVLLRQYIYGDQIISVSHSGQNHVLHTDHLGSVRFVTTAGVVTGRATMDSFGNVLETSGNAAEMPGFAGRFRDTVTGWTDMRARDYDGAVGRFTTSDPYPAEFNQPGTLNRYAFALNNPANFTDPTGYFTLAEQLVSTRLGTELMKTYSKNLGKLFLTAVQICECVIRPGNQMRTMGAELVAQGVPRGEVLYDNGTKMIAAGLNQISDAIKEAYKNIYNDLKSSVESKYDNFGKPPAKSQPKHWLQEMEDHFKKQKEDFLKKGIKEKFKAGQEFVGQLRGYVTDITVMLSSANLCEKAKIAERRGASMLNKFFG